MKKKNQLVLWANPNEVNVGIYRKKKDGKWLFKAVVGNDSEIPFIYIRGASSYKSLDQKEGWHSEIGFAVAELPLETWFNYVELNIHPNYADVVEKKIRYELKSLGDWLMSHIEYARKHPKQCKQITNGDEPILQSTWTALDDFKTLRSEKRKAGPKPAPWLKEGGSDFKVEFVTSTLVEMAKGSDPK